LVRFTIDRFEENYAVCIVDKTLETQTLHRSEFPKEAKAGDTLYFQDNRWYIDTEETAARAGRIDKMFNNIKNKGARKDDV
jgi:hypothetical protein